MWNKRWWNILWRHNEHDAVSNHQTYDCLLNRLFRCRSKKISKLHVTGLCERNSLVTGEFPVQMASNAENVSIWWRYHGVKWKHIATDQVYSVRGSFLEHLLPRGHFTNMNRLKSQHGCVITCPVICGVKLFIHSQTWKRYSFGMDK